MHVFVLILIMILMLVRLKSENQQIVTLSNIRRSEPMPSQKPPSIAPYGDNDPVGQATFGDNGGCGWFLTLYIPRARERDFYASRELHHDR